MSARAACPPRIRPTVEIEATIFQLWVSVAEGLASVR